MTKNGEIEAHFLFQTGAFSTKMAKFRPTSYLKREHFRRKLASMQPRPTPSKGHPRSRTPSSNVQLSTHTCDSCLQRLCQTCISKKMTCFKRSVLPCSIMTPTLPRLSKAPVEETESFARAQWRVFVFGSKTPATLYSCTF